MQKQNYYTFRIIKHSLKWKSARLIWIAFYKNQQNHKCAFANLPKDIVDLILSFLSTLVMDEDKENCIFLTKMM